jgi:hypothetical protein
MLAWPAVMFMKFMGAVKKLLQARPVATILSSPELAEVVE